MVTIKDVAKRAGVSIAAVSYAINNKEGVNDENRRKILEIVREMGYIPNQQARSLVSKKSTVMGIIISDVTSAYNAEIIKYIERYLHNDRSQLMLGCSSGDISREEFLLERFIAQKMQGIILFPTMLTDSKVLATYANAINNCGIPILIISHRVEGLNCRFADIDLAGGMYKIARYLLDEKDCKSIVMFSTSDKSIYSEDKEQGFTRAMAESGLDAEKCIFRFSEKDDFESGKKNIERFLQFNDLPDAIMAINDISALAVIRSLRAHGYRVPEDLLVTGFDGLDLSNYFDGTITTAGFDRKKLSKQCLEMLSGKDSGTSVIELDLIEGMSTKRETPNREFT